MIGQESRIRVVIPAYNSEKTIFRCVQAVLNSVEKFANYEVIVIDNGGNANLEKVLSALPVKILTKTENHSAAYARNQGALDFEDGILIFVDSDVVCEKNCINELVKPLNQKTFSATIGNYSKNLKGLSFSQKYKQLYISYIYGRKASSIKNDFWTAICAIDAKVFHQLKGFDDSFKGANGEDQEFGIRLTKNGYRVLSVQEAVGQHLNPYGVYKIIVNDYKKGLIAIKNSIENKISISDNRHSKKIDILSVLFSVIAIFCLIPSFINTSFLYFAFVALVFWLMCRIKLCADFVKNAGILFLLRSLVLMFILDLVRFTCVISGYIKFKMIKT